MARTMTVSEVREIYPRPEGAAVQKRWRKLDRFMRAFIERSPFLCLGTANAAGKADVSPRGDPPGFVQILDDEPRIPPASAKRTRKAAYRRSCAAKAPTNHVAARA